MSRLIFILLLIFSLSVGNTYANNTQISKIKRIKPHHTFYWGHCTWYVAKYKHVTWRGNAKDWIKNAKNQGYIISQKPKIGSIVQLTGKGYSLKYGHVAIVRAITKDYIIVSEANYKKLGEINYRKIKKNSVNIDGYIL